MSWGNTSRDRQEYAVFCGWYLRMAAQYGLDQPVAMTRMRKAFVSCRRWTRETSPFDNYELMEAGIRRLKKAGLSIPPFEAMLVRNREKQTYGVETLIRWGRKTGGEDGLLRKHLRGGV